MASKIAGKQQHSMIKLWISSCEEKPCNSLGCITSSLWWIWVISIWSKVRGTRAQRSFISSSIALLKNIFEITEYIFTPKAATLLLWKWCGLMLVLLIGIYCNLLMVSLYLLIIVDHWGDATDTKIISERIINLNLKIKIEANHLLVLKLVCLCLQNTPCRIRGCPKSLPAGAALTNLAARANQRAKVLFLLYLHTLNSGWRYELFLVFIVIFC